MIVNEREFAQGLNEPVFDCLTFGLGRDWGSSGRVLRRGGGRVPDKEKGKQSHEEIASLFTRGR